MTTSEPSTTSPAPSVLLIWEEDQVSTKLYVIPESKLSQEDLKVLEDAHGHLEPGDPKEGLTEADITPLKALLENFTGFTHDYEEGPLTGVNITKVFMSGFIPAVAAPKYPKYMVSNTSWSDPSVDLQEHERKEKELDEKCELHLRHLKEMRELDAKHEAERTGVEPPPPSQKPLKVTRGIIKPIHHTHGWALTYIEQHEGYLTNKVRHLKNEHRRWLGFANKLEVFSECHENLIVSLTARKSVDVRIKSEGVCLFSSEEVAWQALEKIAITIEEGKMLYPSTPFKCNYRLCRNPAIYKANKYGCICRDHWQELVNELEERKREQQERAEKCRQCLTLRLLMMRNLKMVKRPPLSFSQCVSV